MDINIKNIKIAKLTRLYSRKGDNVVTAVPLDIVKELGLKHGDQILWILLDDNTIIIKIKKKT